ncbi:MAG TPA: hypothetical protein VLS49_13430 [Usitatibacter sp.]|nr:hypothetical protein [Usitatibacter sp.]
MSFTCRSCSAPIIFAITKNDRRIPLDPEPVADGNILVTNGLDASGKPAKFAEQVDRAIQPPGKALYRSHFASCDKPEAFRKRGPKGGVHVP